MKVEKSKKNRKSLKYESPTLFSGKKLKEKSNKYWVKKKVVNESVLCCYSCG